MDQSTSNQTSNHPKSTVSFEHNGFIVANSKISFKIAKRMDATKIPVKKFREIQASWWFVSITKNLTSNLRSNQKSLCLEGNLKIKSKNIWMSSKYEFTVNGTIKGVSLREPYYKFINSKIESFAYRSHSNFYLGDINYGDDILVEITIKRKRQTTASSIYDIQNRSAKYLSKMLGDPLYSDFTINVKEKKFKVHRAILASRSSVFKKMFETKMKESIEKECKVERIEPDVFEHMLRFIYGGRLPDCLNNVVMNLYEAAHYYEIEDLKEICKDEVYADLSTQNALETYDWAFLYDMEDLKADAWKIIKREILKISEPLKDEPPSPHQIQKIIKFQQKGQEFWAEFKESSSESDDDHSIDKD